MAYNRENYLKRIIEIQEIVLKHQQRGVTQKWVYGNVIKERFFISYSTFNAYLSVPAKAQLKALYAQRERDKELEKQQLKLF